MADVKELAATGRSQRSIAGVLGVAIGTVNRDLNGDAVPNGTPETFAPTDDQELAHDDVPNGTTAASDPDPEPPPVEKSPELQQLESDWTRSQQAGSTDSTVRACAISPPDKSVVPSTDCFPRSGLPPLLVGSGTSFAMIMAR